MQPVPVEQRVVEPARRAHAVTEVCQPAQETPDAAPHRVARHGRARAVLAGPARARLVVRAGAARGRARRAHGVRRGLALAERVLLARAGRAHHTRRVDVPVHGRSANWPASQLHAAHATHACAPAAVFTNCARHGEHAALRASKPAGHEHAPPVAAPNSICSRHSVSVSPVRASPSYVPAGHVQHAPHTVLVMAVHGAAWNCMSPHIAHSSHAVLPSDTATRPGAQGSHSSLLSVWALKLPGAHGGQPAPTAWCPASHAHSAGSVADAGWLNAGHCAHMVSCVVLHRAAARAPAAHCAHPAHATRRC